MLALTGDQGHSALRGDGFEKAGVFPPWGSLIFLGFPHVIYAKPSLKTNLALEPLGHPFVKTLTKISDSRAEPRSSAGAVHSIEVLVCAETSVPELTV